MKRYLPALALVACGTLPVSEPSSPHHALDTTIHGDTRWNREERWIIEIATEDLARETSNRARFVVVWDLTAESNLLAEDVPRIVRVPPHLAAVRDGDAHVGARGGRMLAWTEPGPIIHVVAERCAELYPVVLHELGHAAGLEDLPAGERGVMGRERREWKFTAADRRECVRVGRCEAR